MSYLQMASVYDALMKDAPYKEWASFADRKITQHAGSVSEILDLGCGTGKITRLLADYGYKVTGVDNSEAMLAIAQKRSADEGKDINWVLQDIRALEGFHSIDVAVSFCDVINYITEVSDLELVFNQVNKVLKLHGLFLFDIHSLHHVEEDLQGGTFAEIYDDISYIWLCDPGDRTGEVYHDLTFFIQENEMYRRFDETHHQRTFELSFYRRLLENNGFQITNVHGDFSLDPGIDDDTERIFIIAEKIGELR